MTNMKPRVYTMSSDDSGRYTFQHLDGYLSIEVAGTSKELAYRLFESYINAPIDGYGNSYQRCVGPLWLDVDKDKEPLVMCDIFCSITPEPPKAFWDEMTAQVKRYLKLIAFS